MVILLLNDLVETISFSVDEDSQTATSLTAGSGVGSGDLGAGDLAFCLPAAAFFRGISKAWYNHRKRTKTYRAINAQLCSQPRCVMSFPGYVTPHKGRVVSLSYRSVDYRVHIIIVACGVASCPGR